MGFNTSIVLLNDRMHDIREDLEIGRAIATASANAHMSRDRRDLDIRLSGGGVAGQVVTCDHADVTKVIAVGGNCASVLHSAYNGGRHHSDDDKLWLLRQLADEMGYAIRKKPQPKNRSV